MFLRIVFVMLMLLLITASGRALHMGVFKAHCEGASFLKKALGGVVSYMFSTLVWLAMYSHQHMGW